VKIIKRGEMQDAKIYRVTCANCKTIFECQRKEGRMESDRNETFFVVCCLVCNTEDWRKP
jgi:RNase P subunit RPR2